MILTRTYFIAIVLTALLMTVLGCSDHGTESSESGQLTLSLKPYDSRLIEAIDSAQATIVSITVSDAEAMILDLTINGPFVEGSATGVPVGEVLVIIEIWDENGNLIMQGTHTVMVAPLIISEVEISLGPPPDRIDNDVVYLHFDHAHGCIDSLTLKSGTGLDLLDQAGNTEMSQYGLGGLANLEQSTKLESYRDYGDSIVIEYSNAVAYGEKTFHLTWAALRGFERAMEFQITESLLVSLGNSWSPGGDNVVGDGDSLAVRTSRLDADIYPVRYDTTLTELHSGLALSVAWFVADQEEVLGYRFPTLRNVTCNHGSRAEGPLVGLSDGYHRIDFAVKNGREAFVVWALGSLTL